MDKIDISVERKVLFYSRSAGYKDYDECRKGKNNNNKK